MAEKKKDDLKAEMTGTLEEVLEVLQPQQEPVGGEVLDIDEVVARLEESLETLSAQMDEIYEKTGMTREQLEEYASDPKNFSEEEWSLINQIRGELNKFDEEAEEAKLGMPHVIEEAQKAAEEAEKPKKKKKSGRRKNWLQS